MLSHNDAGNSRYLQFDSAFFLKRSQSIFACKSHRPTKMSLFSNVSLKERNYESWFASILLLIHSTADREKLKGASFNS